MGWLAAGALLVVLAFVVGGPAAEQGLLGSRSSPTRIGVSGASDPVGLALDPETPTAPCSPFAPTAPDRRSPTR